MRHHSPIPQKERRYPKEDVSGGDGETWADPWARRRTPIGKKKTRSYSSGSSSRSSRSRSSSYSSYTSRSRSSSRSASRSLSRSRSITPPIHPRQRVMNNRGKWWLFSWGKVSTFTFLKGPQRMRSNQAASAPSNYPQNSQRPTK